MLGNMRDFPPIIPARPFRVVTLKVGNYESAILGPDDLIESQSWMFASAPDMERRAKMLNDLYERGFLAGHGAGGQSNG